MDIGIRVLESILEPPPQRHGGCGRHYYRRHDASGALLLWQTIRPPPLRALSLIKSVIVFGCV